MEVPTNMGPSWEPGIVIKHYGKGVVDWVDDDDETYDNCDLKGGKWNYLDKVM